VGDGEDEAALEEREAKRREDGVDGVLVSPVAVEQRGSGRCQGDAVGAEQVAAVDDGQRHGRAVLGGGPEPLGAVVLRRIAPSTGWRLRTTLFEVATSRSRTVLGVTREVRS